MFEFDFDITFNSAKRTILCVYGVISLEKCLFKSIFCSTDYPIIELQTLKYRLKVYQAKTANIFSILLGLSFSFFLFDCSVKISLNFMMLNSIIFSYVKNKNIATESKF